MIAECAAYAQLIIDLSERSEIQIQIQIEFSKARIEQKCYYMRSIAYKYRFTSFVRLESNNTLNLYLVQAQLSNLAYGTQSTIKIKRDIEFNKARHTFEVLLDSSSAELKLYLNSDF